MKKITKIAMGFTISVFLLIGCENKDNHLENDVQETETVYNQESHSTEFITYENYQKLFNKMKEELAIPEYSLNNSTPEFELTIIDKEISFGKRKYITKDGEFTGVDPQSTQEILFYQNNEGNRLLTITIAYTESIIGNDIVFYNMNNSYNIDERLTNKVDLITISYKNLIISILQTSLDKRNMNETIEATKRIVEFLEREDK